MNPEPDAVPPAAHGAARGVRLRWGFGTDIGLVRENNEDSLIALDPVFAVADGMGGHEAGEVASALCVRTLAKIAELPGGGRKASAGVVQQYLLSANARIREATGSRAGTTLAGLVVVERSGQPNWLVMNIGDSRIYRLSAGVLTQISVDHSAVQEMVDAGHLTRAQAAVHPRRNVVTRALGAGDEAAADFWLLPAAPGDRMLVCSDGLTGELEDDAIAAILAAEGDPQAAVDELIQAALRSGGRDNVTAIVIDAQPGDA
ncbi:PP2C family serine/threonine-protein phosphatase [Arthrobacter oryzae]|uniref:Serine/threonine-protein phosphatase n=1 Tax=Arthrobacter oryzae TaxID=409290 RepID=A0A3N0C658_9MICC|nr:protein phosphatase 2C domain-containing protein [Arthrobacter oryzae]RNL57651.1 serine/threonine-protein phosphatase [Arthrobacter oryzae]